VSGDRASQADKIIALTCDIGVELVHDSAQVAYGVVPLPNGARAVHAIRSNSFRTLIAKGYYEEHGKAPQAAAIADARAVLEGLAIHDRPLVDVSLRVAGDDDAVNLDLGDDDWTMVHITREGWSEGPHGETLFRRAPGMLALPRPVPNGSLEEVREFVRSDDEGFALELAFLLNALRPHGPYPILMLGGEQGSAKTSTARVLRALVDPNRAPVRAECRDERDLAISANNGHVLAFDNLSHLSPQMSDALCRLATGGGYTTRTLYTDQDETIFDAKRPVIITSIVDVASRPDLLDRSLVVRLLPIKQFERKEEQALMREFEAARPRLLGALLDAVSVALRNLPETRRTAVHKPRMADAYMFARSGSPSPELLTIAWSRTAQEAMATTLESSLIAAPLQLLVGDGEWCGTATILIEQLSNLVSEAMPRRREWPKTPRAVAAEVRRIAPALRAAGIDHSEEREPQTGNRLHTFTNMRPEAYVTSVTSVTDSVNTVQCGDHQLTQDRHPPAASVTRNVHTTVIRDPRDDSDRQMAADFGAA